MSTNQSPGEKKNASEKTEKSNDIQNSPKVGSTGNTIFFFSISYLRRQLQNVQELIVQFYK